MLNVVTKYQNCCAMFISCTVPNELAATRDGKNLKIERITPKKINRQKSWNRPNPL
jgi:hypothetical protein